MGFLASIVSGVLQAVLAALAGWWRDKDRIDAHTRASKSEASSETQEAIKDIADARSTLPDAPDDVDALAGELRRRKSGERHFGNPGTPDKGSPKG
jgi:hypothetical protein